MRPSSAIFLVSGAILLLGGNPPTAQEQPEYELTLECPLSTVRLGDEIPLQVRLTRKRGRPVQVNALRLARNGVSLHVTHEGRTRLVTRIYGREVKNPDGQFVIEDSPPPASTLKRGKPLVCAPPLLALLEGELTVRAIYTGLRSGPSVMESNLVRIKVLAQDGKTRVGAAIETSEGSMLLDLWPDRAFLTVLNFLTLAGDGRYDGLTFHRVIKGYLIQGGDPKGDGTGGPDWTIPGEFDPGVRHVKGVVSMARAGPLRDSAGSQFFIMHGEDRRLDGKYAAFGKVIDGLDVLDRIAAVRVVSEPRTGEDSLPDEPVVIRSIRLLTR